MSTSLKPITEERVGLTPMYKVLGHNDSVTTMDFVVQILVDIFHKKMEEAIQIMLDIHKANVALIVVLPLEQAEFRVEQAHSLARTQKYPLTFTIEPA